MALHLGPGGSQQNAHFTRAGEDGDPLPPESLVGRAERLIDFGLRPHRHLDRPGLARNARRAAREPRHEEVGGHPVELEWHARKQEDCLAVALEELPRGGSVRVVEDLRPGEDLRLFAVVRGEPATHRGEAPFDLLERAGIRQQPDAERDGRCFTGQVVRGRAEAAANQHEVARLPESAHLARHLRLEVADHALLHQLDAVALEQRGQAERVGVQPLGREQLGTHCEYGRAHGGHDSNRPQLRRTIPGPFDTFRSGTYDPGSPCLREPTPPASASQPSAQRPQPSRCSQ